MCGSGRCAARTRHEGRASDESAATASSPMLDRRQPATCSCRALRPRGVLELQGREQGLPARNRQECLAALADCSETLAVACVPSLQSSDQGRNHDQHEPNDRSETEAEQSDEIEHGTESNWPAVLATINTTNTAARVPTIWVKASHTNAPSRSRRLSVIVRGKPTRRAQAQAEKLGDRHARYRGPRARARGVHPRRSASQR
jgi:hypothetical protein